MRNADSLTVFCEPIVWKIWELRRLTILWASTARYRDSFTFTFTFTFTITFTFTCYHGTVADLSTLPFLRKNSRLVRPVFRVCPHFGCRIGSRFS
jgi:hypothetical protein